MWSSILYTPISIGHAEFGKFLEWFVNGGGETTINGKSWEVLGIDRSTRDTGVVHGKIDYLVALFRRYFNEVKKTA